MARLLKVWGGNHLGRYRCIIATTTKKAAMEAIDINRATFEWYYGETGNVTECALALAQIGVPLIRPDNDRNAKWKVLPSYAKMQGWDENDTFGP